MSYSIRLLVLVAICCGLLQSRLENKTSLEINMKITTERLMSKNIKLLIQNLSSTVNMAIIAEFIGCIK